MSLVPDYYFEKFNDISAEFLCEIGVRAVLLDVDNTLEPYENAKPGEHVISWLLSLKESGILAAIVSNNHSDRIDLFNEDIMLPAISDAGKPFAKNLKLMLGKLGVAPDEAAFIGDQIFTDVWAARNAGMRAILVPPINDKRDLFTKFKRLLEKPIMKAYYKKNSKESK